MSRPISLYIKERNEKLCKEAREEIQRTNALDTFALAQAHGISTQMVRVILKDGKVEIPKSKTGPRAKMLRESLSPIHSQIGRDLAEYRFFEAGGKMVTVANELKTNSHRYSQMEAGLYDFSLQDLIKIAAIRNTTLSQLVTLRVSDGRSSTVDEGSIQHPEGSPQQNSGG